MHPQNANASGVASVVTLLAMLFWLPFVRARVVKGDYSIRWYHFFLGKPHFIYLKYTYSN